MSATIGLVGPSTSPGAPQITPAAVDTAVNTALATNAETAAAMTLAETTRAEAAEAANTAALTAVAANTAAIAAETVARAAADAAEIVARDAAIAVEATRATAAEAVNASAVATAETTAATANAAEATRATAVESAHAALIATNAAAVTAEATARTGAIAAEAAARNAAIAVETARAEAAEAAAGLGGGPPASTLLPLADADPALIGTLTSYAHGDHVHPIDITRYAASNPAGYQTAAQVAAAVAAGAGASSFAELTGTATLAQLPAEVTNLPFAISHPGVMTAAELLFIHAANQAEVIPAGLAGFVLVMNGGTGELPLAPVIITADQLHAGAWTNRGTLTVSTAGSLSITNAPTADLALPIGDGYRILGPGTADTQFADFGLTGMLHRTGP